MDKKNYPTPPLKNLMVHPLDLYTIWALPIKQELNMLPATAKFCKCVSVVELVEVDVTEM